MTNNLYDIVLEGLTNQLDREILITPDKKLKEDLGLPSIKLVLFLTEVTEKLNINIMDFSDYELLNLKSVQDIYLLLNTKLNVI